MRKLQPLIENGTSAVAMAACQEFKALLESCAQANCSLGFGQIPCNDPPNINLPCPGPCCGYGKTPPVPPGARK